MSNFPEGPWLIVVGMHRSGTSAVTGALAGLGFNMARSEDRMDWPASNPEHWESLSAALFNESLLAAFGGSWDAPPELPVGWHTDPDIVSAGDPTTVMAAAYPDPGPLVWKDPRLCLLLPYWRERLPGPVAVVFVGRSPLAVARSLQQRDGMDVTDGLALWERYNRSAIEGLAEMDSYVADYEVVVDDPGGFIEGLVTWLRSLRQFEGEGMGWDVERAVASIVGELRHQPGGQARADGTVLLPEQRELVELLAGLQGGHRPFGPPPAMVESAWTTEVIRLRREEIPRLKQIDDLTNQLHTADRMLAMARADLAESNQMLEDVYTSSSWRLTKPLRSSLSSLQELRNRSIGS